MNICCPPEADPPLVENKSYKIFLHDKERQVIR